MKRKIAPQFDLPAMAEVFNLRTETTHDGERIDRERQARDQDKAKSAARQNALPLDVSAWRLFATVRWDSGVSTAQPIEQLTRYAAPWINAGNTSYSCPTSAPVDLGQTVQYPPVLPPENVCHLILAMSAICDNLKAS